MWAGQQIAAQPFPSTHWSLVDNAGRCADPAQRRLATETLLRRYLPALRAYLHARSTPRDRVEDLLQGFIADSVIGGDLICRADRGRGRFRAFLLAALRNFVAKQLRRDRTLARSPRGRKVLPWEESMAHAPAAAAPADSFDVAWAREALAEALRRMRSECHAVARPDVWDVFQGRLLAPALEGAEPVAYETLMRRHGFGAVKQAFNVLITAKRTFDRSLRSVIAEYARSEEEIDEEIRSLKTVLSAPPHVPASMED